jgi:hypothetical protein
MKSREEHIEFAMNYCQHYEPKPGSDNYCAKGVDIRAMESAETPSHGGRMTKWGPCIGGHTLENPHKYCPHWVRRTREYAEKRADGIEDSIKRMTIIGPVVSQWRKKQPIGKSEVIECPACKGRLHLSQSSYNGHVHGKCETKDCVSWME